MGTAGAYKFAEDLIREPTVVLNGDILTDLDLKSVIRQHKERNAIATIVLTPVEDASAYGVVETEGDGRVLRFLEKPKPEETSCKNINAGTYVLEPSVLDLDPKGRELFIRVRTVSQVVGKRRTVLCSRSPADLLAGYWHAGALPSGPSRLAGKSRHAHSHEGSPWEF